ncbi:MAG: indolepyruvate oxidoreductase subunit beta [Syntrophobacteraceae bacterium]
MPMGKEMRALRIFFTGVGGQGTLLATRLVGEAVLEERVPVLMSEIHGMAQRGGVVESSVVMGSAASPIIADGEADIVIAFEPIEAARALPKCNPKTVVITSIAPVAPFTVTIGQSVYPDLDALYKMVESHAASLIRVDADGLARSVSAERSSNVIMVGVLAGTGLLPVSKTSFEAALLRILPERLIESNLRALDAGYRFGAKVAGLHPETSHLN